MAALKEDKQFISKSSSAQMVRCCKDSVKALAEDIKRTESEIEKVIEEDERLKELFSFIESVPGAGQITATEIVINTKQMNLKESVRQESTPAMRVLRLLSTHQEGE